MDILGDRHFVEVPGSKTHELPPLLVHGSRTPKRLDKVVDMATGIIEAEDMIPPAPAEDARLDAEFERRRMDLALNLVDQYMSFLSHWSWGDSIVEWIRQCEMTFGMRMELRALLRADLWPHAGRTSFIHLLRDKDIDTGGVTLEKAVGMRLTFRQPPPIKCFSNQFLFYLRSSVASTAYETWAAMTPDPVAALPPERFTFDVVNMSIE